MKKENLKKLLALTIALTTSIGILAGCGSQQIKTGESKTSSASVSSETSITESSVSAEASKEVELEPVTLKWYVSAKELAGTPDVVKVFNEKLAEVLPNTTVEFKFVADYKANWPLFMAAGEKIDIAWAGWKTPYQQDVIDGNIMAITDLMAEYAPNLVAEQEIWKQSFATAVYEGELYGIPNIQPVVAETQFFEMNVKFSKYVDLDAFLKNIRSTKKLTSELLDIIEAGIQKGIDEGEYKVGDLTWAPSLKIYNAAARGYMMVGTEGNRLWFDPESENPEPMYFWELPEFKMVTERLAQWYDKGWITESQAIGQLPAAAAGTVSFASNWNANWGNADERGIELITDSNGHTNYKIMSCKPEEGYIGMLNFGSENTYTVIPYTSENPERAMMLLNILHDEPGTPGNDLMNLLCYGFAQDSKEAKDYGWYNYAVVEEDGQLKADNSVLGDKASMHKVANYNLTNTYKVMHDGTSVTKKEFKEYAMNFYEKIYPQRKETLLANMVLDYTKISDALAAMKTVYSEYQSQLTNGGGGTAKLGALYEAAMAKLKEAGLDEVKAELQAQMNAYRGK